MYYNIVCGGGGGFGADSSVGMIVKDGDRI